METKRESWIMYRSFVEAGKFLSDEQRGKYYTLIFDQMFDFVAGSSDDNMVNAMFMLISPQIEANIKKYKNWIEPKNKQTESKTEAKDKQTESKTEGNEDVYVYEDVYEDLNEQEKKIIEIYESEFPKMDKEFYIKKLKLLSDHLINLWAVEISSSVEKIWKDDNWFPMYKSVSNKKPNYKIAIEKWLSIADQKEKYDVKDFRQTLTNRIKKDLSPKKFN